MFPNTVNVTQAPAVAGDFASANPRHSTLSIAGGYVAGTGGLTVGLFAWEDATGTILVNNGSGVPTGFLHRNQQAMITTYLTEFGNTIPAGMGIGELFNSGDFWAKNAGAGAVTIGMKAFATLATGVIVFAAAGATVAGAIETKWIAMTPGAAGELVKISSTPLG